ncbi:hypothetical protein SUGI_0505260 [Cryptomeria japonica]|nr:hypothetical protein SUGI_0505260 [Cryptomeria japonica]
MELQWSDKVLERSDAFDAFEAGVDGNGCVLFDKHSSSNKVCKSKGSTFSVACVFYFDEYLDSGDENHHLGLNGGTVLSLANKGLHGPHLSQALMWAKETRPKHNYKIPLAPSLEILNQENESHAFVGVLNVSSR